VSDFVDGLIAKKPGDNAPDFIKANVSIKRKELIDWLGSRDDDWVNVQIKESKGGKWYAQVDDWKPDESQRRPVNSEKTEDFDDDIPF
jgi:hypothetical protein